MKHEYPADIYKLTRYESAPPLKLVLLMYEGALRFVAQARIAMEGGDTRTFQDRCLRAQAVVGELRLALEPSHAPELAGQLQALYLFAEARLREAMLEGSAEPLDSVQSTLKTLLDGWSRLEVTR